MKKIMVVGAVDSGKTTLINKLYNVQGEARKTQSLEFGISSIDTPGEYIENPRFYQALMATALQAEYVLFVQDATRVISIFPPGLGQVFPGYTLGVITKIDHKESKIPEAEEFLTYLGLKGPTVKVSALTGEGMIHLREAICWDNS